MKAPYSPDSLQNTLNGKEQFSFNMSKRREINPYTSSLEKTSTCCGKARTFPWDTNFLNLLLRPLWLLLDSILNQIRHWLHAVQHCLYPLSSADKFRSTRRVYHLEKSKHTEMDTVLCSWTFIFSFICIVVIFFLWEVLLSQMVWNHKTCSLP